MMTFLKHTLCFLLFCFSLNLTAQVTLSGKIIDDYTGEPMDGVKVKVKGLNAGAFTDDKGSFTISIQAELPVTLISSYLGYADAETTITRTSDPILIRLLTDKTLNLVEVNVRSFASDKEKESALSIETMSLSDIQQTPSTDFYEGLSI